MNATLATIIASSIILLGTTLGSLFVFFVKKVDDRFSSIMLGLSGGIMMAAAFFGLILPSINESGASYDKWIRWLPPLVGFILGGVLLWGLDKLTPHMHFVSGGEEGPEEKRPISKDLKFFLGIERDPRLFNCRDESEPKNLSIRVNLIFKENKFYFCGTICYNIKKENNMLLVKKLVYKVNKTEAIILGHLTFAASKLFNVANYERHEYKKIGFAKRPNWFDQKKNLKTNMWYKNLPSQTAQDVLKTLDESWKSYDVLKYKFDHGKKTFR